MSPKRGAGAGVGVGMSSGGGIPVIKSGMVGNFMIAENQEAL